MYKRSRGRQPLGQHFLADIGACQKIVAAAETGPDSRVVEIGPGEGALTTLLASHSGALTLVEADPRLAERARRNFPETNVISARAEEVDFSSIEGPISVVGNLPYYASVHIYKHLTAHKENIERMVLMFQKEVALRIGAIPGHRSYGSLSVFSAYNWETTVLFTLKPSAFVPPPKVESAVILFIPRRRPPVDADEAGLFRLVRIAFARKRRTLRNNLKGHYTATSITAALEASGLSPTARAEEATLHQFAALMGRLEPEEA